MRKVTYYTRKRAPFSLLAIDYEEIVLFSIQVRISDFILVGTFAPERSEAKRSECIYPYFYTQINLLYKDF